MRKKTIFTTKNITLIGIMAAMGTVIYMVFPEVPIIPGVEHLKIDFSDIPAVLVGLTVHPICGVMVELIKNLIHLFKTSTVGIGEVMNFLIGSMMIFTLWGGMKFGSRLFKKDEWHPLTYYAAAIVTVGIMIVFGWLVNLIFTPLFYLVKGWPLTAELLTAGVFGSTLLNTIKVSVNLLVFYPLYYHMAKLVRRMQ